MIVQEFMKDDIACVTADSSVREAAELMAKMDCGVLPIVHDTSSRIPIGVLTDRDIVLRCVAQGRDGQTTRVSDIATRELVTCDEHCDVAQAFDRMRTHHVGRLLVTDEQGGLIGIITMRDLLTRVPREVFDQLPGAEEALPRQQLAA